MEGLAVRTCAPFGPTATPAPRLLSVNSHVPVWGSTVPNCTFWGTGTLTLTRLRAISPVDSIFCLLVVSQCCKVGLHRLPAGVLAAGAGWDGNVDIVSDSTRGQLHEKFIGTVYLDFAVD